MGNDSNLSIRIFLRHILVPLMWSFTLLSGDTFAQGEMVTLPPGVSVSLSMPKQNLEQEDKVLVAVEFTNTSNQEIRFLKWATPFDSNVHFDMFDISFNGNRMPYVGRKLRRAPAQEKDYVQLAPNAAISTTVDIQQAYGIVKSGQYTISYRDNKRSSDTKNPAVVFRLIEDRIAVQARSSKAAFTGCSASDISVLNQDVVRASAIAKKSYEDLKNAPVSQRASAPRYKRWFGVYTPARYAEVLKTMERTHLTFRDETLTFECNQTCTELASVADFPFEIRVCGPYFGQPSVATQAAPDESRAGTLIHELTHFTVIGGTEDHAYFTTDSLALALNSPDLAVNNADNFYFFAENIFPPLPMPTMSSLFFMPAIILMLDD